MSGALELRVDPPVAPLWQRRAITVRGAAPGALVTIRATTRRSGGDWAAQASYLADADGRIDLDRDAPVSGDVRTADAMGLCWAQRREPGTSGPAEPLDVAEPLVTRLHAREEPGTGLPELGDTGAGGAEAHAELVQQLLVPGVERREVRRDGLVGTLFRPAGPGPFPTAIVLNGSGGGINEARAAQYAARGIQALALGYFRGPGLPDFLSRTPLEYFERAIAFVRDELDPAGGAPIVTGQSRGGELSLLLAATFPDRILAIAGFVPGAYVFGAQGAADPADGWDGPSWTHGGQPLEHLWHDNAEVDWQPWNDEPPPTRHADVYVDGLRDRRLALASRIPIERFAGPVACVSGLDDRAWPSSGGSRMALASLARHGHRAERLHLDYEDAGHGIGLPHLPSTDIERVHPVSGVRYSNGGTPRGNARASADSFEQICAFIHRAAAARPRTTTREGTTPMPAIEHLEGQWREWRHARVAELGRPYGWTALVAQYWLTDASRGETFELLPGTWSVEHGRIVYTPPVEGPNLVVDGEHPSGPVEIRPGRNQTYGHGTSAPVYFGRSEVETIVRTSDGGDPLYAIRVRDPEASAGVDLSGLTAYDYDPAWRLPASFTPAAREDVEQPTVESGVRETTARIGTLRFEFEGRGYELAIIGKDTAHGVQPVAHLRDLTSGRTTYGAGRVVELQFADEAGERIDVIDFNYLHALPCAFTNFVTCPVVPQQNHLDFEVLAGEQRPVTDIARVLTFEAPAA